MRQKRLIAIGLFTIVALTWGGSFVAIAIGLEYLPSLLFAAARMYVAAGVVIPLIIIGTTTGGHKLVMTGSEFYPQVCSRWVVRTHFYSPDNNSRPVPSQQ